VEPDAKANGHSQEWLCHKIGGITRICGFRQSTAFTLLYDWRHNIGLMEMGSCSVVDDLLTDREFAQKDRADIFSFDPLGVTQIGTGQEPRGIHER
jgi:hypothetical protein